MEVANLTILLMGLILLDPSHAFGMDVVSPTTTSTKTASTLLLWNRKLGTVPSVLSSTSRLFSRNDNEDTSSSQAELFQDVGFVLLAGGKGSRMKASMPKQFLELFGAPILHHSLDLFLNQLTGVPYVVLVLDPMYQPDYQHLVDRYEGRFALANPGQERQGSVETGLQKLVDISSQSCSYVAIHDSARPLVTVEEIEQVVQDAKDYGASVLAVPCKATIKESGDGGLTVLRTLPRSRLWEVHTPQVIRIDTLQRGFAKVQDEELQVTDDVSIVEALGEPVKLTLGQYTNLKITTPEDMDVAKAILEERQQPTPDLGF